MTLASVASVASVATARIFGVAVLMGLVNGCLSVSLAGHACPCVDGFLCIDDVCIDSAALPACPDGTCASPLQCIDGQCKAIASECPATFPVTAGCADRPPSAPLLGVCDDGDTRPFALFEEVGFDVIQGCTDVAVTRVTTASATGAALFTPNPAEGDALELTLSGSVTFDIDLPASCIFAGCPPSQGSGECGNATDTGCRCTGVVLPLQNEVLIQSGDAFFGDDGEWFGCSDDADQYLLREDVGGSLGPILVFGG